ncbi:Pentatricopeptide repeat-containing protein [Arabidopsis thaliana]|uniref:Pentatricopeptide repeat-containing protein At1g11900 n=4 Tax=Arabidopsis TaxID=3701 RepID=PPR35_ARATH|nr:Tetratricopeptide repeat (TPR)-like superfamily protein [Arabidopsis thaliana]Q5BIV3.1 RecName: Full=Pentatricopeptide repeat-containing protein At1g11900 [Arabidopsis thaliana]AAX22256.1 At1g11900 [Arabidopsis thaliana]AEE28810.1 Tetratricopeptide repeat (TPR)-like superfamily protein [Arabidopsis thaliana]KAG7645994.1 Pentatricopeptide repeat [Arabidopsis thaliana x Arabidopsis arenosa]|eukprot:NP_172654.2 Tetratricopeptide repeat (TPR)-like superfamily protein [Arabidopsis thaliana]
MMKWSIVKRIPVYGGSFISMKHMMLVPADLSWSCSFSGMHSLINTGEEDEEELLKKIVNHSESGSKIISKIDYTNLVEKFTRDGNLSGAYDLLQSLQEKNICLPISVFKNLLAAAGELNDMKLSCRVFREVLILPGKEPLSSDCYLNLARAFINTDDCTYLTSLLKEISESSLPYRLIVMNRIIFAFAETRQIDKVLMILKEMKEWECKPDVITYNSVLDILGRAGLVNEILGVLSTMKEDCSVSVNIITYNTVLNGMRKACRFDMCLVIYNEMVQCGIEPDLLSYTAVIDSLGRSGNVKESLRLFDEMKQRQIRPSVYVYRALIDCLKKSGDFQSALQLSDELKNTSSLDLAGPQDFKRHLRSHRR